MDKEKYEYTITAWETKYDVSEGTANTLRPQYTDSLKSLLGFCEDNQVDVHKKSELVGLLEEKFMFEALFMDARSRLHKRRVEIETSCLGI